MVKCSFIWIASEPVIVAIGSMIAACSSVSTGATGTAAADASVDATSTVVSDAGPRPDSANADDAAAGDDADTCATARADYDTLLATTVCGHCLTTKCSAFVANAGSQCSTINASLAVFECEMVSHECSTSSALAAFSTVELKELYTCGNVCGDTCHLAGAPVADAGDDDAEALDASDAADAPDGGDLNHGARFSITLLDFERVTRSPRRAKRLALSIPGRTHGKSCCARAPIELVQNCARSFRHDVCGRRTSSARVALYVTGGGRTEPGERTDTGGASR